MRIIGGYLKRRLLLSPPEGSTTRPVPDMVRQALFNLLRGHFEDVDVYDGFAGVGSFGLEAISRGARRVVMVERDRKVASVLEANAQELGVSDKVEVVVSDALGAGALARCPRNVHVVFFDPPYAMVRDPETWPRVRAQFEQLIARLDETGYAVLRTPWPCHHEVFPTPDPSEAVPARDAKDRTADAGSALDDDDSFDSDGDLMTEIEYDSEIEFGGNYDEDLEGEALPGKKSGRKRAQKPKKIKFSLQLNGAIGPETHEYGTTAVHLYMRDPNATNSPATASAVED
jgi:16S rRNA (guanine(966)-N(2))-methyltransferase RsmD